MLQSTHNVSVWVHGAPSDVDPLIVLNNWLHGRAQELAVTGTRRQVIDRTVRVESLRVKTKPEIEIRVSSPNKLRAIYGAMILFDHLRDWGFTLGPPDEELSLARNLRPKPIPSRNHAEGLSGRVTAVRTVWEHLAKHGSDHPMTGTKIAQELGLGRLYVINKLLRQMVLLGIVDKIASSPSRYNSEKRYRLSAAAAKLPSPGINPKPGSERLLEYFEQNPSDIVAIPKIATAIGLTRWHTQQLLKEMEKEGKVQYLGYFKSGSDSPSNHYKLSGAPRTLVPWELLLQHLSRTAGGAPFTKRSISNEYGINPQRIWRLLEKHIQLGYVAEVDRIRIAGTKTPSIRYCLTRKALEAVALFVEPASPE